MPLLRLVRYSISAILLGVLVAGIINGLYYLIAEVLGNLWSPLALIGYGTFTIVMMVMFLIFPALARLYTSSSPFMLVFGIYAVGTPVVAFFLTFVFLSGQFLRHWSMQFGGFSPQGGDYLAWTLYAVSWLLDNGLGNFGQIFGWEISPIHPINDTAKSVVWVYNLALEFLAVAAVLRVVALATRSGRGVIRQESTSPRADNQTKGA